MTRYNILSNGAILVLALLISVLVAVLVSINIMYLDMRHLPVVYLDKSGTCVKVVNYENGHAFNCQDVNVLLRRYKTDQAE